MSFHLASGRDAKSADVRCHGPRKLTEANDTMYASGRKRIFVHGPGSHRMPQEICASAAI